MRFFDYVKTFEYIILNGSGTLNNNDMSKGNDKTYGNKGNNHPYQFNALRALGEIVAATTDTSTLATPVTGLATSLFRVSASGAATVAAGKRKVNFLNTGSADASVNGGILKRGEFISYGGEALRDTLAAIPYDALTSELLITTTG